MSSENRENHELPTITASAATKEVAVMADNYVAPLSTFDHEEVEYLLAQLKNLLEPLHGADPELHQLWLETEWLRSNLNSDRLCLPRNWELSIFTMIRDSRSALRQHREVYQAALSLAATLKTYVPLC